MTLTDLASIGSLVSGIAVLISLIYLSLQVKQAEKNQRALMQQGRANRISENCYKTAEPELCSVYSRGSNGDETLTVEELSQFMLIYRGATISAEDSFLQNRAGLLGATAYDSFVASVRSFFMLPGMRAAWRLSERQYGIEFAGFMNGVMEEIQVAPEENQLQHWIEAVRSEKLGKMVKSSTESSHLAG